jgi:hypothetical protein
LRHGSRFGGIGFVVFRHHLQSHRSWTRVLLRFVFDPKIDLFARITRERRVPRADDSAAVA